MTKTVVAVAASGCLAGVRGTRLSADRGGELMTCVTGSDSMSFAVLVPP